MEAKYQHSFVCVLCVCVCLCVVPVCVCVIVRAARVELTLLPSCQRVLNFLNNVTTGLFFLTLVVNVIKAAFGTQRSCFLRWLLQRFIL